ncbi:protein of unknown function (plasmid) [Cupriavidus taiwanensis]|uniref:Uncharacterized protein n=1 Tax=Cupriavidus taiwanensis TaxID=164546 RepID=A0A375IV63_9BURK|nr:protein of unknown function [Cupriavidus taiwanensis]
MVQSAEFSCAHANATIIRDEVNSIDVESLQKGVDSSNVANISFIHDNFANAFPKKRTIVANHRPCNYALANLKPRFKGYFNGVTPLGVT